MKTSIKHDLGKAEALQNVKNNIPLLESKISGIASSTRQSVDLIHNWNGDQFEFHLDITGVMSGKIDGKLFVEADAIEVDLELPLALRMFENTVKTKLEDVITEILTN